MTGKILWQSLKFLVECDKQISTIEKEIVRINQELVAEQGQVAQLKVNLDEQKHQIVREQKNVDLHELQAKKLQEEELQKRKNIENIKHQKEYAAFEKELEQITEQRKELDDVLVRSYYQVDAAQKKYTDGKKLTEQKIEQLSADSVKKQEQNTQLIQQRTHWQEEYQKAITAVPQEWLTRYERMKHSVADPIVPVLSNACSACYYAILQQDLIKLKKSGILLCRNCYRFLYYSEEEQQDNSRASY